MHGCRAIQAVALVAAIGCAPAHRAPLDDDMPHGPQLAAIDPPATIDELKQRLATILEREHIPGVAVALVGRDGPIWVGGVGVRDLETGAAMDGDTAFRVGSLSKSIVALGVMRLADQGKLDIDRPLREILPGLVDNPWEAESPVTLAQCLEHTAGLDDVRFNEVFADDERISVRDTLRINPRSRQVRWRPGTRHSYSNVGYTLAARAIEVASGEPFDDYLRREILAPLGIRDADFLRTDLLASRLATGYLDEKTPAAFHPFAHRPSGALLASANDLAKLVHFWIRRGDGFPPIVSPAGLARIERSGTLPYPHLDNEYGFANYGDVWHPVLSRGHDGGMPGFHASFRYFREQGVGYAMLLNSNYTFRGYFEIRQLLFAYLTRGRVLAPPPRGNSEAPGADYFALANPRSEIFGFFDTAFGGWHVSEAGGRLHVEELFGPSYDLIPTDDGGYRQPDECGSTVRFLSDRDGTPLMISSFSYGEAASGWFARLRRGALSLTMLLLRFAPWWTVSVLAVSALRRRRLVPYSLALWPAVAGLCCFAVPHLLEHAFLAGVIGVAHPLTIAICALTIGFAIAGVATLVASLRWWTRPDRPPMYLLVFPTLCGLAFTAFAIWAHTLIGLRTWAW